MESYSHTLHTYCYILTPCTPMHAMSSIHNLHVLHACIDLSQPWLTHTRGTLIFMCDTTNLNWGMTQGHMLTCHSIMCVTWCLVHVCHMLICWHDPCATCWHVLIHTWDHLFICDMSHWYATWLIHMWHDSFMWTWLIHMWHDSSIGDITHSCGTWS